MSLEHDLKNFLHKHPTSNVTNTPENILANLILDVLSAWADATLARDEHIENEETEAGKICKSLS